MNSCAEISNMKNIIFSAKFTLTPLGVTLVNGVPSLLVDRQMALVRNYAIQSTGSSIVYTLTLDCLGNKTTQSQQRTRNVVWLCAITKGDIHCLGLSQVGSTSGWLSLI